MSDTPDLIGTSEAARIIGVTPTTLTRWVAAGRVAIAHKLPGLNGAMLFAADEVERARAEYASGVPA